MSGGADDSGTVFKITPFNLHGVGIIYTLKTLVSFNGSNGYPPWAGLLADTAGNLYGTTGGGGGAGIISAQRASARASSPMWKSIPSGCAISSRK